MRMLGRILRNFLGYPFLFLEMCGLAVVIITDGESELSEWALASWTRRCVRISGARIKFQSAKLDLNKS